ncbi:MAG: c-type cytochrome [Bacteroidetes bacterium]|nr:c-type cytochrome [Bacteroidota bacterium]
MKNIFFLISALSIFISSCKKDPIINDKFKTTPYIIEVPKYFPIMNTNPLNPMTVEGFELGRKLYYDPILSNDGRSCASCHDQKYNFTTYASNALVHVNLAWNTNFLWNGHVTGTLEDIMMFEVGDFFNTDINKLNNSNDYKNLFKKAYNIDKITKTDVAYALAQFFRARVSYNSKFDKFIRGETDLSPSELNGYILFTTEKGDCFHCHTLPLTSDNQFRNIGLDSVFEAHNLGRYEVTHNPLDKGKFKVPTLRNIEVSAPYMHDGRFKTLAEVVEFYNSGVKVSSTIDPIMTKPGKEYGLKLTTKEKSDLISFLKTFTDTSFLNNKAFSKP